MVALMILQCSDDELMEMWLILKLELVEVADILKFGDLDVGEFLNLELGNIREILKLDLVKVGDMLEFGDLVDMW